MGILEKIFIIIGKWHMRRMFNSLPYSADIKKNRALVVELYYDNEMMKYRWYVKVKN